MNSVEGEALRFQHAGARSSRELQLPLARIRRVEQHQQTLVNWLLPPDQSVLETTVSYQQSAVEISAALAQMEQDPYIAQVYRFGTLEHLDHLYRFAALLDRLEGKDANNLLQSHTDIRPGRPTRVQHRAPEDDLRRPYDRRRVLPTTRLGALTALSIEGQIHEFLMTVGPLFADPLTRQLYAEIGSIGEQRVTEVGSVLDPEESFLERWVLHEANEVWNYWSCLQQEQNRRVREIWERFLAYELGHLQAAIQLFQKLERRDAAEILPDSLPDPIPHEGHRAFLRQLVDGETELRTVGALFVPASEEPANGPSARYRQRINQEGSPSDAIASNYRWTPGTEVVTRANLNVAEA
jgi:hypothetical protein